MSEQRGLRGIGGAAALICLGLLFGDALTVEGGFGKETECVRRKTELMLRDGQAAAVAFHGGKEMGHG